MKPFTLALGMALLVSAAAAQPPAALQGHPYAQTLAGGNPALLIMDSDLLQARQAALAPHTSGAQAMSVFSPQSVIDGRIQAIVGCTDIAAVEAACAANGITVTDRFDRFGVRNVTVLVDSPLDLDPLVSVPEVVRIDSTPLAATCSVGAASNNADVAQRCDTARTSYSVTGSGVRVGVLSDTFNRVGTAGTLTPGPTDGSITGNASQLTGDLPASVRIEAIGPATGTDEGRAMCELVYDIAPGASISFASAYSTPGAFATNITDLASQAGFQCDVIVDDVIYFGEPMYQDGAIALAYEDAYTNYGVACFSSAGNNADSAFEGSYVDSGGGSETAVPPSTGADLHDFDSGGGTDTHMAISVPNGDTVTVTLHWNQPYSGTTFGAGAGSQANYDLYITEDTALPLDNTFIAPGNVTGTDNVVDASTTVQGTSGSPSGDPYEVCQVTNTTGSTQTWYVVVDHQSGVTPGIIHVDVNGATITDPWSGARTMWGHACAQHVMGVGAIFYFEWDADATGTGDFGWADGQWDGLATQYDVESFSALGGNLPFHFNSSGTPVATFTRAKPDLSACDGCNTTFFGSDFGEGDGDPNFFGTSAAAPNAAAVAALMIERANDFSIAWTPSLIHTEIVNNARDVKPTDALVNLPVMTAGYDFYAGSGVVDAVLAVGDSNIPVELSVFSAD